ncbi:MAG: hypothetical protein LUO87_00170 [Methanomicrobiales archaeon]|nr:hypothetical protein [Methanomicrobiales archaeon]MDD1660655.1 hypothetical protein [Methanomicrobiales archaeon]
MSEVESHYRKENGMVLLELTLKNVMQIFNSLDPSPFHEKDLDDDAEEYITDMVEDFPLPTPLALVIYLPPEVCGTEAAATLEPAIHHHFSYKAAATRRSLRQLLQRGRISLAIGIGFIFLTGALSSLLASVIHSGPGAWLSQGLLIVGWVAMWEPINIFLYGWWPVRRKMKAFEKIAGMEVRVEPYRSGSS